ncbi:MAG: hypothetical protein EZS28_037175, partial [Streblomastix strix]
MRMEQSRAPDRAGTFQPMEISIEIYLCNREEERADEDGSSEDENEDFMITGFYLRFKDQSSQQRLEENKMIIPFRVTKDEKDACKEMLKDELEEQIVIPILQDQVKRWNHTFLIKKPNGTWRKILDVSKLNKEIKKLHFKMHGQEEVQYLANQMDQATSLDLKSAFHHIAVSLNSIPYLVLNFNINNYAYIVMPFGTKHSPIFQAEAIDSILRQIRIHSQMDNINREMRNRTEIDYNIPGIDMGTEGNVYKDVRREKLKIIQALKDQCNTIYKNKCEKIRQLAALICRPNLLRSQIKEASLYLVELDKANIYALKKKSWVDIMIVNSGVIRELKRWIRKIGNIQPESLINRTIICMLKTDAFPQSWGATRIYKNEIELTQHDYWSEKEAEMKSRIKEIKAIYNRLRHFEQIFKKMQDQPILTRSENTTIVYDIGNWKAKESLLERIKQVFYLVKRIQLQNTTIHIPGKLNSTADSLSRLCRSGDYPLKDGMIQMICKTLNYMT